MPDNLDVSRRELIGALARWSVPTVVTFTLGARVLEAKASCPPCQRKQGQQCKACSVSQMLNCNCEPCLGPPYCSPVGNLNSGPSNVQAPGSGRLPGQPGGTTSDANQRLNTYFQLQRERARMQNDPFSQPLYRDPYGTDRSPFGRPQTPQQPGLYDRLRPDTSSTRRRN